MSEYGWWDVKATERQHSFEDHFSELGQDEAARDHLALRANVIGVQSYLASLNEQTAFLNKMAMSLDWHARWSKFLLKAVVVLLLILVLQLIFVLNALSPKPQHAKSFGGGAPGCALTYSCNEPEQR